MTNQAFTLGNFMNYTYDNIGQLKTARGYETNGTPARLQEQFGYAYDSAWNLNTRTNNALVQNFTVNTVNELTGTSRSGTLTVAGTATEPSGNAPFSSSPGVTNVTVNTSNAVVYADGTFASTNQPLANGNNTFTAIAHDTIGRWSTNVVTVNLPTTNSFSYDLNGNLLTDGTRNLAYDDENQLTSVWVTNVWRNDFVYDGLLRKRIERDYSWNSGTWTETNEVRFIYDGYLVVQERNANNLPQVTYTRGMDLAGGEVPLLGDTVDGFQGAGGIGGLLARTDMGLWVANKPFASACYFNDAQGNVIGMASTNGTMMARYEYDPFGNMLSMTGPLAGANRYRFSSKEWDDSAGLYYYGFRFYDPTLQRWPNKDPIQELGGFNLYEFAFNNPTGHADLLGLCATVSFANGSTQTGCTAEQLESIVNNAPPNSIQNITITGHSSLDSRGGANGQFIDYDLNNGELTPGAGGIVVMNTSAAPLNSPPPTLASLLNGKLAPGATITLNGCNTGAPGDPNNIASVISKELPNVPVTGQNQPYHYIPIVHVHVPQPYDGTTTYVNGCPQ